MGTGSPCTCAHIPTCRLRSPKAKLETAFVFPTDELPEGPWIAERQREGLKPGAPSPSEAWAGEGPAVSLSPRPPHAGSPTHPQSSAGPAPGGGRQEVGPRGGAQERRDRTEDHVSRDTALGPSTQSSGASVCGTSWSPRLWEGRTCLNLCLHP